MPMTAEEYAAECTASAMMLLGHCKNVNYEAGICLRLNEVLQDTWSIWKRQNLNSVDLILLQQTLVCKYVEPFNVLVRQGRVYEINSSWNEILNPYNKVDKLDLHIAPNRCCCSYWFQVGYSEPVVMRIGFGQVVTFDPKHEFNDYHLHISK